MGRHFDHAKLAQNIRTRRQSCRLTQAGLAKQAGCSVTTISRIEHGTQVPSVQLLFRLARALDCHVHVLLQDV